jgi:hypothetical protein
MALTFAPINLEVFRMRKRWPMLMILTLIIIANIALNACKEKALPTFVSPFPSPTLQKLIATSPLLTPQKPTTFPTSQPGMGTVRGVLIGMMGGELFLAKLLPDEDFPLFELDVSIAPKAIVDESGNFIFVDVPPGRYGLVFWTPLSSFLLNDPKTGTTLTITVKADDTVEIGEIFISP